MAFDVAIVLRNKVPPNDSRMVTEPFVDSMQKDKEGLCRALISG